MKNVLNYSKKYLIDIRIDNIMYHGVTLKFIFETFEYFRTVGNFFSKVIRGLTIEPYRTAVLGVILI